MVLSCCRRRGTRAVKNVVMAIRPKSVAVLGLNQKSGVENEVENPPVDTPRQERQLGDVPRFAARDWPARLPAALVAGKAAPESGPTPAAICATSGKKFPKQRAAGDFQRRP